MAETIDDITIDYEEDGQLVQKEIDKVVLTRGAWTTILFKYQAMDKKTGEYGEDKFTIRRFQKRDGEYKPKSKFNISGEKQAKQIIEALQSWVN